MVDFTRYTDKELKHWVWLLDNCPATKYLISNETYLEALKEYYTRLEKYTSEDEKTS